MAEVSGLKIRQFERKDLQVNGNACPHAESASVLSFSPDSGIGASGFPILVTDLSEGGLGFRSGVFVPRRCLLQLRLNLPGEAPTEFAVRIQRVTMIDRTPTYALGAAFVLQDRPESERIARLVDQISKQSHASSAITGEGTGDR